MRRTNITEPVQKYGTSRGALVSSFLLAPTPTTHQPLADELAALVPPDARFAGFNLLLLAPAPAPTPAPRSLGENAPRTPISYEGLFVTNHGGGGALASRPLRADDVRVRWHLERRGWRERCAVAEGGARDRSTSRGACLFHLHTPRRKLPWDYIYIHRIRIHPPRPPLLPPLLAPAPLNNAPQRAAAHRARPPRAHRARRAGEHAHAAIVLRHAIGERAARKARRGGALRRARRVGA